MFAMSVTLLALLAMGKYTNPETTSVSVDYDAAWEELFGHLKTSIVTTKSPGRDKFPFQIPHNPYFGKPNQSKPKGQKVEPAPPAEPFVFDPASGKLPSIGANSYGSMEGIAISQNRGISLGIYMVNSSYNNFNTVFGNSNVTKSYLSKPTKSL